MLNTLMKSAKDANIRTVFLGAIVVVSGLAAMGRSSPLDLNRKIYGKFNLGHAFGFVTALCGLFIVINSISILRNAKNSLEDMLPGGELIGVIEEQVTA
jgi:hypothetical protein